MYHDIIIIKKEEEKNKIKVLALVKGETKGIQILPRNYIYYKFKFYYKHTNIII